MTTNKSRSTGSRRAVRATVGLLTISFLAARLLFWILPNVFEPWNAQTIDRMFELRSMFATTRPPYDSTIVHVDISDHTIRTLRQPYLGRQEFARVVENLHAMHVAAQAWDFILLARSKNPEEDSMLIQATAKAQNVYFGLAFQLLVGASDTSSEDIDVVYRQYLDQKKWKIKIEGNPERLFRTGRPQLTFLELAHAARGLGFLNITPDRDGVFRRAPLLVHYKDSWYPSLPFQLICDYLNVQQDKIVLRVGESITLKNARHPDGQVRDIVIPVDDRGNMIVNFIGTWERMKHYNFADVLRASEDQTELEGWAEELSGKLVIVSQVTTGSADVGPVPTDNNFPLSGVHANVMHTILTGNFLKELNPLQMFIIELLLAMLLFLLSLRSSSLSFSVGAVGLVVGFLAVSAMLFLFGNTILNVVRPTLILVFGTFSVIAYRYLNEEKQKEALRRSFEAYFPPAIVQKVIAQPELVTTGAQKKELTILFSDIKSFTMYTSTMKPDEIHKLMNEYFEAMVDIVFRWGGTVDKFIGDGLMVFFGDPEPQDDHAVRCVKAAIEMQKKCRELRAQWEAQGYFPLQVRIGINTGEVVVGNMGSLKRLSYTVLGSNVNLAQRLEANAPVEGIMISRRTYELVKDHVLTRPVAPVKAKGLEQPIEVYEVVVNSEFRKDEKKSESDRSNSPHKLS